MKGQSIKNIENPPINLTSLPRSKGAETEHETPMRIDLKIKLGQTHPDSHLSFPKTKKPDSKSKEQELQSTVLLMSDRTGGVNEFLLTTKESILPVSKSTNIKSYLRIKPNKNVNYMPFGIYNNQTIIYDRSVYKFDFIFEAETPQNKIYEIVGKDVTEKFIEGYNGTIFAYGSTGSGKTYTMFGNDDGLVPSVVQDIFSKLDPSDRLSCSMIEIYKQNLIDLLSGDNDLQLRIKQINSICTIQNLSIHQVKSQQDTLEFIKKGNHLKKIRETHLNQSSSRSHIIFTFHLEKIDSEGKVIKARFNLVDLAGSEKVFKSKVQGQGLEEAKKINLSLSCLGNTISALVKNSDHIPYRQSKLTRILKQSLMGNSITRLIVTCSINEDSIEETISSIKFAQRAQKVQTQAQIAYNISKFKGDKEQKQKQIRSALQKAQSKLNRISEMLNDQQNNCNKCKQIKQAINRNQNLSPEEIFNFNPLNNIMSPKSRIDLKQYYTNPSQRFSSVPRREQSKKSSFKNNFLLSGERDSQYKQVINKRIFQLKLQNEKLREEKIVFQTRIKVLQQKFWNLQKQGKGEKCNKKIIKLGVTDNKPIKIMKQNQPNFINTEVIGKKIRKQMLKNDQSLTSNEKIIIQNPLKQLNKDVQFRKILLLINQSIQKFNTAAAEYRNTILPFEIDVLKAQINILQKQLIKMQQNNKGTMIKPIKIKQTREIKQQSSLRLGRFIQLQTTIKKSICNYYFQISMVMDRLFQINCQEIKEDSTNVFKEKKEDISEIRTNIKDILQDSDDLLQLSNLLQKSKILSMARVKQKNQAQKHYQSSQKVNKNQLWESYNQFLDLKQKIPFTYQIQQNQVYDKLVGSQSKIKYQL